MSLKNRNQRLFFTDDKTIVHIKQIAECEIGDAIVIPASPWQIDCIGSALSRRSIARAASFSRPMNPLVPMRACSSGRVSKCQ